jgi:hypothetical protein
LEKVIPTLPPKQASNSNFLLLSHKNNPKTYFTEFSQIFLDSLKSRSPQKKRDNATFLRSPPSVFKINNLKLSRLTNLIMLFRHRITRIAKGFSDNFIGIKIDLPIV